VIVARDRIGATIDAVLPRLDAASITAFARRAQLKFHVLPAPGLPKPEASEHHSQKRKCLPRASKGMDAAFPWRRDQEPAELPLVATHRRSPIDGLDARSVGHGRRRARPYQQALR
jgi:hypothetical protein